MSEDIKVLQILKISKFAIDTFNKKVSIIVERYGLNSGEVNALMFFYDNPNYFNAKDFVSEHHVSKAYVSKAIKSLSEKKLIKISNDIDKRFQNITITKNAFKIINCINEAREVFSNNVMKDINDEKTKIFFEVLSQIEENIIEIEEGI